VPVFEVGVQTVYVDVSVTRDGRDVAGLTAADFEVLDNGVRQQARLLDTGKTPLRVVLAFDVSGSLDEHELGQLRAAADVFLNGLHAADDVALLGFGEHVQLAAPPTLDRAQLRRALVRLRPGGSTSLYDALYAALVLAEGPRRSIVVAFTDGRDNLSVLGAEEVLRVAAASDSLVHVIALAEPGVDGSTESPHALALRRLAETTGGRTWNAASTGDLAARFADVLDALRGRYLLAYEPAGVRGDGEHRLEVRLRKGKGQVRARSSYAGSAR
jgi:VWFA-related protein